jgi:hypothetical protein
MNKDQFWEGSNQNFRIDSGVKWPLPDTKHRGNV